MSTTTVSAPRSAAPKKRRFFVNNSSLKGRRLVTRYIVLVVVLLILVGPVFLPLLGAFKSPTEAVYGVGATLFPQHWSIDSFKQLFEHTDILIYVRNSLIVCTLNIVSALVFSTMGGYMLSRKGWKGRKAAFLIIMSALIFPFESIMLALYAQVHAMGLYDTVVAIWLPGMMNPFHLLLMRAAFMGIPDEIEDAACIDGANEVQRFFKIFLPQVKGTLVVVGLTAFIFAWQDYLWPVLVTKSGSNFTIMRGIATLDNATGDYRVVLAGAITAVIPIFIVFFSSQKYFFRGIEEGGLKF